MMNLKHTIGLIALAALAFIAGRSTLVSESSALASAPQSPSKAQPEKPRPATAPPTIVADELVDTHQAADPMMQAMAKAGTPGEHHKVLDVAAGEFEGIIHYAMAPGTPMIESKGTLKREWVLDGRFLCETVDAISMGQPYHAIGYLGYNNFDQQYEIAWMDNTNTAIMVETATYDPEKKVMTTHGTSRDPVTGRVVNGHGTWDMSNPNRHVMTGSSVDENGKEFKSFDGVFERKSAKK